MHFGNPYLPPTLFYAFICSLFQVREGGGEEGGAEIQHYCVD